LGGRAGWAGRARAQSEQRIGLAFLSRWEPHFSLLEVQTVSRATLLFGMTWIVNAHRHSLRCS